MSPLLSAPTSVTSVVASKGLPIGSTSDNDLAKLPVQCSAGVNTEALLELELTRFSGHIMLCVQGVEEVKSTTAVQVLPASWQTEG